MLLVKQYNDNACFGACLESFLRDVGGNFSHEGFIKNNLNLFNGSTNKEGSCNTGDYPKIANLLGLDYKRYTIAKFLPPSDNETIIFTVFWNNDKDQVHSVRFSHYENRYLYVMNPTFPKIMPVTKKWIRHIHKFTKT